jgi:hypothetical protein
VVSRFSALQKACQNIEMAANAGVFRFCIGVVRPCGSCAVPARFLPDGRAVPASRPNGSCLAAKRFLPGRTVPARPKRFLPGRTVPAKRFLPGSRPVPATAETVPARFPPGSCDRRNGSCAVPARFLRPPKRFLPSFRRGRSEGTARRAARR